MDPARSAMHLVPASERLLLHWHGNCEWPACILLPQSRRCTQLRPAAYIMCLVSPLSTFSCLGKYNRPLIVAPCLSAA